MTLKLLRGERQWLGEGERACIDSGVHSENCPGTGLPGCQPA